MAVVVCSLFEHWSVQRLMSSLLMFGSSPPHSKVSLWAILGNIQFEMYPIWDGSILGCIPFEMFLFWGVSNLGCFLFGMYQILDLFKLKCFWMRFSVLLHTSSCGLHTNYCGMHTNSCVLYWSPYFVILWFWWITWWTPLWDVVRLVFYKYFDTCIW